MIITQRQMTASFLLLQDLSQDLFFTFIFLSTQLENDK